MAPVTATRAFFVRVYASSDGILFADRYAHRSAAFDVGGYDCFILYEPRSPYDRDTIDPYLRIESKEAPKVTASFSVSVLDPTGSLPPWKQPEVTSGRYSCTCPGASCRINVAPDPRYLTQGGLLFHCIITVFPPETTPALFRARPKAPESDMMEQLGKIYETEDGADVTYSLQGKLFRAHKIILAMRSPVFKAQLYGGMKDSTTQIIEVEDMLPDVFKALLHYIYTDALPGAKDDGEVDEDVTELLSHLLVASDRYAVERLWILCECKLCDLVGAENWVRMLVFAEEQQCEMLKDACVEFMATSDRVGTVVASKEYAQPRRTHPLVLIDALEKSKDMLNLSFRKMKV